MKTKLKIGKKKMWGIPLEGASKYPAMRDAINTVPDAELGEYEDLFLGYGTIPFPLPYTMQDCYDGKKQLLEFDLLTMENSFLRAEFVPALGGRLWSLFDKRNNRELLVNNPEFLPGNLAVRNAWFSTGVEFNFARPGHDPQTCSPRFAAVLRDKTENDVLRIYEYSRDRNAVFQLDFFLPEDSEFLYLRGRITNPNDTVIPMYYWANIALPEDPGARVIVPAVTAYTTDYNEGHPIRRKTSLPDGEGFDATYPCNFWNAKDHFYNIPETSRKYEALVSPDGTAFIHWSPTWQKTLCLGAKPGGKTLAA